MAADFQLPIGSRVWFPAKWECGTLDSVMHDSDGNVMAYVILRDDGKYHAVDMQTVEIKDADA